MRTSGFGLTRASMNIMSRRDIRRVKTGKSENHEQVQGLQNQMSNATESKTLKKKKDSPMGLVNFSF